MLSEATPDGNAIKDITRTVAALHEDLQVQGAGPGEGEGRTRLVAAMFLSRSDWDLELRSSNTTERQKKNTGQKKRKCGTTWFVPV